MKRRKAHFQLSIFHFPLLLLLFSCSRGGDTAAIDEGGIDGLTPPVVIEIASRSTAAGAGEAKTVFKEGTSIGIVPSVGTSREYVYNANGTFTAVGEKILFGKGVSTIAVEAFYPYTPGGYARLSVKADQNGSTDGESNYYLSDVLHAAGSVTRENNRLKLTFRHVMSKLIFTVSPEAAATITSLTLGQQPLSAAFSFNTDGSVKAASDATGNSTITAYTADNGTTWRAIIIPRDNASLLPLQVTTNDGKKYEVKELATNNFKPGQQYTYTITVKNGLLTVSSTGITSWADDGEQQVESYTPLSGSGTEADPFLVKNPDDFKKIKYDLGAYYKQMTSFDMTEEGFDGIEGTFIGTYDGNGKMISQLKISGNARNSGLFQNNAGTIKNIKVVNAGAAKGIVLAKNNAGGVICGWNCKGGTITNCSGAGITGSCNTVGGICGGNEGTISNCTNSAEVKTEGAWGDYGGICGVNAEGGIISGCNNRGTITGSDSNTNMGGICGYNEGTIHDCKNFYEALLTGNGTNYGGICGSMMGEDAVISVCGNLLVKITGNGTNYGGICGYLQQGTILECTHTGTISGGGANHNPILGENHKGYPGKIIRCDPPSQNTN